MFNFEKSLERLNGQPWPIVVFTIRPASMPDHILAVDGEHLVVKVNVFLVMLLFQLIFNVIVTLVVFCLFVKCSSEMWRIENGIVALKGYVEATKPLEVEGIRPCCYQKRKIELKNHQIDGSCFGFARLLQHGTASG